jgi:hypothetical protein
MNTKYAHGWAALLGAVVLAVTGGCGPTGPEPEGTSPASPSEELMAESNESLHPERRGIGALPLNPHEGPTAQLVTVDPRRSLVVTDQVILANFQFFDVMNQLVTTSGVPTTPLSLFQQWWDTARVGPGLGLGPNCNSPGVANMNGFPYTCPRAEGIQATVNPFLSPATNPNSYIPIGLFNRFDLAPLTGENCGEYRIVFAKRSGISVPNDRNLIIFEAVLPNPTPAAGLEGCRLVANFWANLTADPSPTSRGAALRNFYFAGPGGGFMPVLHIDNLGNRPPGTTGQVRVNMFMSPNWLLREYRIRTDCSAGPCRVQFIPVTVKTNPGGNLFAAGSPHPLAPNFQNAVFPGEVKDLAINNINLFNMDIPNNFNSGQSDAQSPVENHYVNQSGGNVALMNNIQNELNLIPSTLTPGNIVARSMALSCAGCHQLSNGANLGGGLVWPPSLGFVHISEQTDPGPDGPRHRISPALNGTFIPHRKVVFETFLNGSCGDSVCDAWETPTLCSLDCP